MTVPRLSPIEAADRLLDELRRGGVWIEDDDQGAARKVIERFVATLMGTEK